MIQNYNRIDTSKSTHVVLETLESALSVGNPERVIKKFVRPNQIRIKNKTINLKEFENIHIVSFGKAADSMTKAVNDIVNAKSGIVVIPENTKPIIKNKKFRIIHGSHPIPTKKSLDAAIAVIDFIKSLGTKDFVIFLVSGGGSSILSYPNKISISDKSKVTKALLRSGATIQEINCVRKHLSKIKGGRLVDFLPCQGCALLMSDVQDNDMSAISSGCTYFDKTKFSDALKIIKKYKIEKDIPKKAIDVIQQGIKGDIPETPKKEKIPNQIILSNSDCLNAMKTKLKQNGYRVKKIELFDDISNAIRLLKKNIPKGNKSALIFGGETTVKVKGDGKGGRNQELVLRAIYKNLISSKHIMASIGTDGIDGNTKFAGAISESRSNFSEMKRYLNRNDSNGFFKKYGGLIKTGPTHTNLMDVGIIITRQ